MSIILGIDPGSRITGYGVIRQVGRHLEYLGSGCIRTSVEDIPGRLKQIYAGVSEVITQFQPDVFAIEEVFMGKNASSALKLGQARGSAIVAAVNADLAGQRIRSPFNQAGCGRYRWGRQGTGTAHGVLGT